MKTLKIIFSLTVLIFFMMSCKNELKTEVVDTKTETTEVNKVIDPNATIAKAEFTIEGMSCAVGCAKKIEKKLAGMEGVKSAKVDFDKKLAMVEYAEGVVTTTSLEETVTKAGEMYSVKEMKTVESFTPSGAKHECKKDCKKECCKGKEKVACKKDCKKACCAGKA